MFRLVKGFVKVEDEIFLIRGSAQDRVVKVVLLHLFPRLICGPTVTGDSIDGRECSCAMLPSLAMNIHWSIRRIVNETKEVFRLVATGALMRLERQIEIVQT